MRLYRLHTADEIAQHCHLRAEARALDQLLADLEAMHERMAEIAEQSLQAQEAA
jgi:hypothetical protein